MATKKTEKTKKFRFKPNKRIGFDRDDPTNGARADSAKAALIAFHTAVGEAEDQCGSDEDGVKDLFADLLHYCDREGLDGLALFDTAKNCYWEQER